jgi:acetylglutamate kinase
MSAQHHNKERFQPVEAVIETLKYVEKFNGLSILIKLGGAALEDMDLVGRLCRDLALIRAAGIKLIIVHGGGKAINAELERHGISWDFIEGQRVTSPEMMGIIEMVLTGKNNQNLVRTLNASGVKAVGLSGTDAGAIRCQALSKELGQVGRIMDIDTELIQSYLDSQRESGQGYIPVFAPIGIGDDGEAYNINADWAASKIAQALNIHKLIYLTDQDGILDQAGEVITRLQMPDLQNLADSETVSGGMLAKVNTIMDALNGGIDAVHIINGKRHHSLIQELFTDEGIGTLCC